MTSTVIFETNDFSIDGMAVDINNNIYFTRFQNNITKIDNLGNTTIFASGFNSAQNLVFDNIGFPNGYLYVMDITKNIYKVDANGNITIFATNINAHFINMTIDKNNNLYYSDTGHKVFKIDTNGNSTVFIDALGVFTRTTGVAFDSTGNCYVCNGGTQTTVNNGTNQFINKYNSQGQLITASFINMPAFAYSESNYLNQICFDKNDNIYISTSIYANDGIKKCYLLKYDINGNFVSTIYSSKGQILALTFHDSDNIYFFENAYFVINRIFKYDPSPSSSVPCFNKDTKILTNNGYIPIQQLRKGDLVKTIKHGYLPIDMIGKREIYHPATQDKIKDQLYKCSQSKYPEIFEDLILTGCHCILVDRFISEQQKEDVVKINGNIYITDNKYRLPACVDDRSSVYEPS